MLKEGQAAPPFELLDDQNQMVRLKDFQGQTVVLYFYPRADTPGCTTESCNFRDSLPNFRKLKVAVLGISPDTPSDQAKFKKKFNLTFPLLCDTDRKIAETYGVLKEKNMYGKMVMGIERTTFIIGPDGKIAKIFPKVRVDGHVEEVLSALQTSR